MAFGKDKTELDGTFGDDKEEAIQVHNQYLELVDTPGLTDPKAASLQIVKRILSANSMEELEGLVGGGALGADELIDIPLIILSDQWFKSSPAFQENSAGVFVVLTCRREDTGENIVVTNGGENVLATVYRMHTLGGIPTEKAWKFKAVTTAAGFRTFWLTPANR